MLLLDAAGPVEVLRKANLEQQAVRFVVSYVGPRATVASSIGLVLADIAPLPESLPEDALVVIAGSTDDPMEPHAASQGVDERDEAAIVTWLARAIRP
ncbi:MAG: GlxA family transcriptional regulator, partial [Beijerinckiaceae bacterium]|nr:GlxA family transcriptional regulator [Beijerinckiaceae bacterium]